MFRRTRHLAVFVIVLFLLKILSGYLTGGTYTDLYTRLGFAVKKLRCVPADHVYIDKVNSVSNWLSKAIICYLNGSLPRPAVQRQTGAYMVTVIP
jgi:hypothetical protein